MSSSPSGNHLGRTISVTYHRPYQNPGERQIGICSDWTRLPCFDGAGKCQKPSMGKEVRHGPPRRIVCCSSRTVVEHDVLRWEEPQAEVLQYVVERGRGRPAPSGTRASKPANARKPANAHRGPVVRHLLLPVDDAEVLHLRGRARRTTPPAYVVLRVRVGSSVVLNQR